MNNTTITSNKHIQLDSGFVTIKWSLFNFLQNINLSSTKLYMYTNYY